MPGGGIAMRFGELMRCSASVPGHIHGNVQIPNGNGAVRITLAKDPEDIALADQRLMVFEKLRLGKATVAELEEAERNLIKGRHPEVPGNK